MARIRTIKPEFPQSESMGRVSRDARLLFIQLWTLCDDEGRTRGNSRMLASLLFPYDDDAPALMDVWIEELREEGCIERYQSDGSTYIQVSNWLNHQKIDKPSRSKIPAIDESSIILANIRERSSEDQGSRIKDQGEEGTKETIVEQQAARPSASEDVSRVFSYWQSVMGTNRAVLDQKREKVIQGMLKAGYSADDLCKAIRGCSKSAFHMGQNENGAKYNGLDLICRNAEYVDRFMAYDDAPPVPRGKQATIESINRAAGDAFLNDSRDIFGPGPVIEGECSHAWK